MTSQASDGKLLSWLRLIRTPNIGPITFRQLINQFGSAHAALEALPDLSIRGGRAKPIIACSIERAEREIEELRALGGELLAIGSPNYPPLLSEIYGPPPLLSVIGSIPVQDHAIAIVGARNASASGKRLTQQLATELGGQQVTIISGLARGIDAAAHRASLQTGTIAVLAGGLDKIYPSENIELAQEIVQSGGALLTEMPLGTEPRAKDFPRRNRLVSGLSHAVLVVEAAKRSGSLITARLALEQNRDVFAIPGSPLDPRASGGNHLIQQGALLVTSADDIIKHLQSAGPRQPSLFEDEAISLYDLHAHPQPLPTNPETADRQQLESALSYTPTSLDEIATETQLDLPLIHAILLEMELAGRLERSSNGMVALS